MLVRGGQSRLPRTAGGVVPPSSDLELHAAGAVAELGDYSLKKSRRPDCEKQSEISLRSTSSDETPTDGCAGYIRAILADPVQSRRQFPWACNASDRGGLRRGRTRTGATLFLRWSHMPIVIAGSPRCTYPVDIRPAAAIGIVRDPESLVCTRRGHQSASRSCWSMRISDCFTIRSTTFSKE